MEMQDFLLAVWPTPAKNAAEVWTDQDFTRYAHSLLTGYWCSNEGPSHILINFSAVIVISKESAKEINASVIRKAFSTFGVSMASYSDFISRSQAFSFGPAMQTWIKDSVFVPSRIKKSTSPTVQADCYYPREDDQYTV